MSEFEQFRQSLLAALDRAAARLFEVIGGEQLYVPALSTSGECDFSYLGVSANTEERLQAVAKTYAHNYPEYAAADGRTGSAG